MAIKPSHYKILQPFEAWVQQSLPAIYDDSLSYTDLLAKLLYYVNTLAENNTTLSNDVTNAINYINNYFDNLDVQDEINNKLDKMAEDGTLSGLIQPLFDTYKTEIDTDINNFKEQTNQEISTQNKSISNIQKNVDTFKGQTNQSIQNQNADIYTIQSQQNVLKQRMDTFTSLPSGSTSGDAELEDIRTWFNGKTSSNAGSAVRGADELEYNLIQNLSKTCVKGECVIYSQQQNTVQYQTVNVNLYKGITYNLYVDSSANCSVTIVTKDDNRTELVAIWGEKSITFTPENDITRLILWINSTTPQKVKFIVKISQKLQNNVLTVAKNDEGDFNKLKDCLDYVNSNPSQKFTVIVKRGVYDLIEEFGENYFNTNQGVGLILNNNVHIIFSSDSIVKCNYTGSNTEIMKTFAPFNASYNNDHLGFTLENLTLECSNVRYAIHDDTNGQSKPYTNKYINCNIKLDNSNNEHGYKQCIGGGCGSSSYIIINNCVFESVGADTETVTYHNGGDGKSNIYITNCYFAGKTTCRCSNFGPATEQSILNVNNCSMYYPPVIIDETTGVHKNFKLLQFNNEIRKL